MAPQNRLIIGSSEKDPDLYYATRFIAPDPFVFAEIRGKKYLIASDLEVDRARSQAKVHEVLAATSLAEEYKKKFKRPPRLTDMVRFFLKKNHARELLVPASFPLQYADPLRRAGFKLSFKNGPFDETRSIKNAKELAAIKKVLRAVERSVAKALGVLKKSSIQKNRLYYRGTPLTSEILRKIIHQSLLEEGCVGRHTIVSCGKQTIDPHHQGSGPLFAHRPIIMDVFPRSETTLYYGDFTRTVVRGKASAELKQMYAAVKGGQEIAFGMIRAGINARKVHEAIQGRFSQLGFRTGVRSGRMQGFFHGTGHGLGLEIHEPPRIGNRDDILKEGQVVTVEPGLYYQGVGGVRLEDVVVVTRSGCEILTKFPKKLEI